MNRNLTITIVAVAIASIGLVFTLTSPLGTEPPKIDCPTAYREHMEVRQNECQEMFSGIDSESFDRCILEAMSSFDDTSCDRGDQKF
ncbi:MAG: hypothetical protein QQN46_00340 [Nitrosopumilus sp.]